MAEGGIYPWKRQEVDIHRGPAANYRNVHRPLSDPPKHMCWVQDEKTKEWRLEKNLENPEVVATATLVGLDEYNLKHVVQSTDTFQGICLRYKITPTELRRANGGFSGTNLLLAPNPLIIPTKAVKEVPVITPEAETKDQKLSQLLRSCPTLSKSEAKCYLELNDWESKKALENAREDGF